MKMNLKQFVSSQVDGEAIQGQHKLLLSMAELVAQQLV